MIKMPESHLQKGGALLKIRLALRFHAAHPTPYTPEPCHMPQKLTNNIHRHSTHTRYTVSMASQS